jgi:hypothetical protein
MWGPITKHETAIGHRWYCNFYGDDGDILIVQTWRAPTFFHYIDVPSYDMEWIHGILCRVRNSDVCDGFPANGHPCSDDDACEIAAAARCMIEQVLGEGMDDQWIDVDVRPSHPLCAPSSEPEQDTARARKMRVIAALRWPRDSLHGEGYEACMHDADLDVAERMEAELDQAQS